LGEKVSVITKESKIIDVPDIVRSLEIFLDKMVKIIEIAITEKLARLIANRESLSSL
jgi:hypothetical protein